ncbi:transglutaminase TgpA family protein [Streptomyces sp.]|uniref:transglutaminase TgpA family protein n=1 Tax=Streptomyces sp. TaxID=1931 RepID=UPI002F4206EF
MSGRARLTVFAAAASMMAACALLPLTTPNGWLFQALLCVCLQSGIGAAARRVPLARPLTVLAQTLVSLIVLTMIFASEQALGGILPGPAALTELGGRIRDGLTDVGNFAIPAPVTPGIRILLVGGVVVIALAVDAIAVTYHSAAPAGLPLLALYSVAAGLSEGGAQGLYFLIAASGYLLLLLAEGRDRLSRWGRVFGGGPAGGRPGRPAASAAGGTATAPMRTGRRIGAMALGIALVAPAVLPSLGTGLLDTNRGGAGSGGGGGRGGSVNLVAALQDDLNQPDNHEVLTYRTDSTETGSMYLRIAALDRFDGKQWSPSGFDTEEIPATLPVPEGLGAGVKYTTVSTQLQADGTYVQGLLPMPYPATAVRAPGKWKYQPEGRMVIGDHGQTAAGVRYTVTSLQLQPTANQLAEAPSATGRIAEQYTKVPDSLPPVVAETARTVTQTATNDYERGLALQRYFTSGQFVYNTQAKSGTGVDAIARFLQTREGFCVHFAFTMATMARTLNIPARVAIGFTPGSQDSDGTMSVGLKDAHAWPELYFEGTGWTRFEPTPYRGTEPAYTQTTTTGGNNERDDTAPHGATTTPAPSPSASASCAPENRRPGDCGQPAAATGNGSGGGGFGPPRILLISLLALLALLVPTTPLLWRTRVRARRLDGGGALTGGAVGSGTGADTAAVGPGGSPLSRRAESRVLLAWREVVDTGWDYGIMPDDSETPRRAMARLIKDGRLSGQAAASAGTLATAVEQTLYAPHPRPTAGLAAEVHRVRAGLHDAAPLRIRLRALLLPRSSARLLWSASARWFSLTQRLSERTAVLAEPLRKRLTRRA